MYDVGGALPFVAGLIDGDGRIEVLDRIARTGHRDVNLWTWNFCQRKYLFLVYYVSKFVDSLTSAGTRIDNGRGGTLVVSIRKVGAKALLNSGFADWSWKAGEWLEKVAKVRGERDKYLTAREVAKMFNVCVATVDNWLKAGKMSYKWGSEVGGKISQRYIPPEEVEKLRQRCAYVKEKTNSEGGMRLVDVAQMLGINEKTLRSWTALGKLRSVLVREPIGQVWRNLVIPRNEIQRLHELKKGSGSQKCHRDVG